VTDRLAVGELRAFLDSLPARRPAAGPRCPAPTCRLSRGHFPLGAEFRSAMVADLARRQAAGEIAADLDPAFVLLALFGAAMAPAVLPQFAEDFTGLPPGSPEFAEAFREQLSRIVAHLAAPLSASDQD
jgi:hypothetical protein